MNIEAGFISPCVVDLHCQGKYVSSHTCSVFHVDEQKRYSVYILRRRRVRHVNPFRQAIPMPMPKHATHLCSHSQRFDLESLTHLLIAWVIMYCMSLILWCINKFLGQANEHPSNPRRCDLYLYSSILSKHLLWFAEDQGFYALLGKSREIPKIGTFPMWRRNPSSWKFC